MKSSNMIDKQEFKTKYVKTAFAYIFGLCQPIWTQLTNMAKSLKQIYREQCHFPTDLLFFFLFFK